jgi:hypothetical protein
MEGTMEGTLKIGQGKGIVVTDPASIHIRSSTANSAAPIQ